MTESNRAATALVLQHHPIEHPGVVADVLQEQGIGTTVVRCDLGQPVPVHLHEYAGLIVMGGPMGVYEPDRYPWLGDEDRLLREAIAMDFPTLGVCLGSQLIASAAGARVGPGPEKEIGWYELSLDDAARTDPLFGGMPSRFEAFEWHGDVFELPAGAVALASSARCPHQAFRLGTRVYALLFHLEVTVPMITAMTDAFADELAPLGGPARRAEILHDVERRTASLNALARRVGEAFVSLLTPG